MLCVMKRDNKLVLLQVLNITSHQLCSKHCVSISFLCNRQQRLWGSVPRAASADTLISDVSGAERGSVDNKHGRIDTRHLPADNNIVGCDVQVIHRSYNGSQMSLRAAGGWWIQWDV